MNDKSGEANADEHLPEEYPGRVVAFPPDVSHLVYAIFGIQCLKPEEAEPYARQLAELLRENGGPGQIERGVHTDRWGYHHDIFMCYWLNPEPYWAFVASERFSAFWANLPVAAESDLGFFKEVAITKKENFNYAAGVEDRVASAALLDLVGSDKFGYWGAYRDRLPASEYDKFDSPLEALPPERDGVTKGQRLTVDVPDNICYIREGQGVENCDEEEKQIWAEKMASRVDQWIDILGADPPTTGCISIRDCKEFDLNSGEDNNRQSQSAFLLSLPYIEKAAQSVRQHLEVRQSFIDMYREPKFQPKMHVWVEVHVIKAGDIDIEYVNCHNKTGFLRFFPPIVVD